MTKSEFKWRVIISSILTAIAIAIIIASCVYLFDVYSAPSEENTSLESGTVSDVYYVSPRDVVIIEMSNGDQFQLVNPYFPRELYSAIGYDLDELAELLEGEEIEYLRMSKSPWIVEIYIDEAVIDNNVLTAEQITVTRIAIVIIGLIVLAFPIVGDILYIEQKYKLYKKAEKKRKRKARRELKKTTR